MRKNIMNLQMFAEVRTYEKDFAELLQVVFAKRAYFSDFYGGAIETKDGIQHNATAFSVKTSDVPVVVGTAYSTDANTGMGTGTGKSTRFGERKEVIYTDTDVPYTWEWTIHEGLDRHTVNNDLEAAVADRLELQAQAKINAFNTHQAKYISTSAGKTIASDVAAIDKDNVASIFAKLSAYFVDAETIGDKVAKVTPDVYNAIIDCGLATSAKGSAVDVDNNEILKFKGFEISEIPSTLFQKNEVIMAYVKNVGKAFTGIETARAIESEDFDGIALQGAGKAGEYVLPANKAAIAKVTVTGA